MHPVDTLGRPLRDLRISVTDRCNFRCSYCMPKEVFGRDYRFLPHGAPDLRGDRARSRARSSPSGVEKIRLTGGEPLLRTELERLVARLAHDRRLDLTLTTNGVAAGPQGAGARATPGCGASPCQPRLARRCDVPPHERRRLPRRRGARRASRPRPPPASARSRSTRSSSAASTTTRSSTLARHFRGTRPHPALHRVHGRRHDNGWRLDDVVPAAEIVERIDAALPPRAGRGRTTAARWRSAGATATAAARSASSPRSRSPSAATAPASASPPRASSTPASSRRRGTTSARSSARARPTRSSPRRSEASGCAAHDRYSEIRTERTRELPRIEMSYIGG